MHPGWTLIIVVILAVLLFSRPGKISSVMEDLGKGIRNFRHGMSDQSQQPPAQDAPKQVADQSASSAPQDRVQS
jgi:TatA/E family protein of Tat protein translocase